MAHARQLQKKVWKDYKKETRIKGVSKSKTKIAKECVRITRERQDNNY